jgi:serine/threonine protein kinase/Tol biopolymer transport system component/DNA-binding winged helix-turn-helix (wHTH) protein
MKATLTERVRLGAFEVDLRAGELRDGEHTVRLQEQPFQILSMLIARGGEVVTREEIRNKLWPNDTVVEFDHSINAAIKKLRRELGDTAEAPKYVETVARRGYRLLVPVEAVPTEIKPAWVWKSENPDPATVRLERGTPTEPLHQRRAADRERAAISGGSLIGKKVSHYRVLSVLGGGGMGMVYKAEDLKLGRQVALKFLPEDLAWDSRALQRFEREARAASSLDHPNICTIYEVEEHEEQPFIVMQLLQGETLRDRLSALAASRSRLKPETMLEIATQICEGLQAAHKKGIIHRDIKPANIFVSSAVADGSTCGCEVNSVKILDFGLAKLVNDSKEAGSDVWQLEPGGAGAALQPGRPVPADATLTRLGSAMGTAGYMSPEQVRGEKLDARSDIFSFGLVLYEMASGQRAFSGESAAEVQEAIVNRAPIVVGELNAEVPRGLEQVISKALEKDREKRYQSAVEMGCDLQRVKSELNSRGAKAGRRWALWAAAVAVVLVLATGLLAARFAWQRAEAAPALKEQQITANPVEDPVIGAAISPNGKYLAYQDQTGLYLHAMESGETRPITVPAEVRNRIFYLSWFPGGGALLADVEGDNASFDTWIIPIVGESEPRLQPVMAGSEARLLYRRAAAGGISPDGRRIAFTTGEFGRQWKAIWVGGINGEAPRKLVTAGEQEDVFNPVWSPDGRWVAYSKMQKTAEGSWSSSIEILPAAGGAAKTMVSESSFPAKDKLSLAVGPWLVGAWSPDWRLLFTVAQASGSQSAQTRYSLWAVRVQSGASSSDTPRQVSEWSTSTPRNVTVTADGKRVTMLRERQWLDAYLGELAGDGTSMESPQRFTLDDRGSSTSGWTHDGQAVLFDSPRNGKREIFRQSVNGNVAERMAGGSGDVDGGVLSPDGVWLLYWASAAGEAPDGKARLMRQQVDGGAAEMVLETATQDYRHKLSCASNPHAMVPCVMSLSEGSDLVFYAVDPLRGKGDRLGKIDVFGAYEGWGLSPDGSSVALVDADKYDGRIEVLNLAEGSWHEITVEPGGEHLQSIAWAADGKSFYATPHSPYLYNILHITLTGKAQKLLDNGRPQWMVSPLPSPDGKYLVFDAQTWDSNVWMMDNF